MNKWDPVDYVVIIFTAVIGIGLLFVSIHNTFLGGEMDGDRGRIIETLTSGAMSIIALYVGAKIQKYSDSNKIDK